MGKFAVILPAAGRSTRFGDASQSKIHADLDGRAVWLRAIDPFLKADNVEQIIIAVSPGEKENFTRRYEDKIAFLNLDVVEGGAERSDTVAEALKRIPPSCDYVAIHDAARPCLTLESTEAVFEAAILHGAALLAIAVNDTIKRGDADRFTTETVSRSDLYLAQTPQVFRRDWIEQAYQARASQPGGFTDDTQLIEAAGHHCAIVPGSPLNLKITTQDDLKLAKAILRMQSGFKQQTSSHPFADEAEKWADLPRLKPSDIFDL